MHEVTQKNLFLVKEHIGLLKAANNFDIYDPATGEMVMVCREENMGWLTKALRFTDYKRLTPFNVQVRTPDGSPVLRVARGASLFLSHVTVMDEHDQPLGGFKQKLFSVGGKFDVLDHQSQFLCSLKGKWTSWDFSFVNNGTQFARVTKRWAGIGKELFTSADNYVLEISDTVEKDNPIRLLILGAVMCIDMVLKE